MLIMEYIYMSFSNRCTLYVIILHFIPYIIIYKTMISFKSLITFICLNSVLVLMSVIMYCFMIWNTSYFLGFLLMFVKNLLFIFGIELVVSMHNKKHDQQYVTEISNCDLKSMMCIARASFAETFSFYTIAKLVNVAIKVNFINALLLFIPVSFIVEIIFDFFHYWTHRIVHTFPILYKYIHKTHHTSKNLSGIVTFQQDAIDYLLTNYIPFLFSLLIAKYMLEIEFNLFMYILIIIYKEFGEIAGHVDIIGSKSFSFPQFIWLPLVFGMELYQKIHHNHHVYLTYNYSKRFSLWDKVFGTYKA